MHILWERSLQAISYKEGFTQMNEGNKVQQGFVIPNSLAENRNTNHFLLASFSCGKNYKKHIQGKETTEDLLNFKE